MYIGQHEGMSAKLRSEFIYVFVKYMGVNIQILLAIIYVLFDLHVLQMNCKLTTSGTSKIYTCSILLIAYLWWLLAPL